MARIVDKENRGGSYHLKLRAKHYSQGGSGHVESEGHAALAWHCPPWQEVWVAIGARSSGAVVEGEQTVTFEFPEFS